MGGGGPRFADAPPVEVAVTIDAAAATVWPLLEDIELPSRFSPEFRGATWLDGVTGPAPGARFLGRNEHPVAGSWQTVCTITDYEPGRRIGYEVNFPGQEGIETPGASWRFELEPVAGDQVRVRYWARIGPGPSLLQHVIDANPDGEGRIVAGRLAELRKNMTTTLRGIKDIAEA